MSWTLNGTDLSDFGVIAGRAPGSNIALSGMFDLPKRINKTYHEWPDGELEPYVDADEIMLGGRDLDFYFLILGSPANAQYQIGLIKSEIEAYTGLVSFSTPYGDYEVKVKSIEPELHRQLGQFVLKMREPEPDLSGGVLPEATGGSFAVDRIKLSDFGLYVSKINGRGGLQDNVIEEYTSYAKEGYQINGRKHNEIKIEGFIKAADLSGFQSNIKALWKVFTDEGLRYLILNDYVTLEAFAVDGFSVNELKIFNNQLLCKFSISLTKVDGYIKVYQAIGTDKIVTTIGGKIVVYG